MEHIDWQVKKSFSECNKYILVNEINCDVSFKVGEDQEVIKAHKSILSTRSPVFERMLNGSFCESEKDLVIPDVNPAAFRALLRYCYYDCLDIEGDVALSVLYVATKYMLPILKRAARRISKGGYRTYLKGNLSETNLFLDVIKYTATTGHEELKVYCGKHLQENLSETNILDVIKYVAGIGDEDLHANCKSYLKEHLSGSNIWDVYTYALNKGDTTVRRYCREYFMRDVITVWEALQSDEFHSIHHEVLLDVLHINDIVDDAAGRYNPGISISEIELFKSYNVWAEAECLRQEIAVTGTNKKTVLGECLSLIRFPIMLLKDLVTFVYPTGILTQAGVVNLGQYIDRDPGSECQVDFPSNERQFVVKPSGSSGSSSTSSVYIESDVRVILSRMWFNTTASYEVTVEDEAAKERFHMKMDTKHGNHLIGCSNYILPYMDIEPPQVLEAGSRYTVTAKCAQGGTDMRKQPGVQYIRKTGRLEPYNELEISRKPDTNNRIYSLTLAFI